MQTLRYMMTIPEIKVLVVEQDIIPLRSPSDRAHSNVLDPQIRRRTVNMTGEVSNNDPISSWKINVDRQKSLPLGIAGQGWSPGNFNPRRPPSPLRMTGPENMQFFLWWRHREQTGFTPSPVSPLLCQPAEFLLGGISGVGFPKLQSLCKNMLAMMLNLMDGEGSLLTSTSIAVAKYTKSARHFLSQ